MLFSRRLSRKVARHALLAMALALTSAPAAVNATTVRRLALPEMVQRAEDVAQVRVLENRVRTDPETLYHWTVTTFEVLEPAKGRMRPGEIFDVEVMGGEAPGSGYATIIADAPRFTLGEELVLFTYVSADGRRHPVGFFQGAVRLKPGVDGLETASLPYDEELTLRQAPSSKAAPLHRADEAGPSAAAAAATSVAPATSRPTQASSPGPRRALPVEQLLSRVREIDTRAREERP